MDDILVNVATALRQVQTKHPIGRVDRIEGQRVTLSGLSRVARIGDPVRSVGTGFGGVVVELGHNQVIALAEEGATDLTLGAPILLGQRGALAPHAGWLGRVIDPDGQPLDGRPLLPGPSVAQLDAAAPRAACRKPMGDRLGTGLAVFDTLLPLARGQRIGLFAGSGVGKSTLLATLARGVTADVVVIALVGERGRELREFVEKTLGSEGLRRSVIVTATSDTSAALRRRCVAAATAVAEHFRDAGQHVLLLVDSLTRFAEAHREIATQAGEGASLRGFPPSTAAALAGLCERAGPGPEGAGDITAIYSILVAGSDMDEPVADMARGVLDGHVVLDRAIAERGRFPAIDVVRSVSRSLPDVATTQENHLLSEARRSLGLYARAEVMIQAGLYVQGSDPELDIAIARQSALDRFVTLPAPEGTTQAFAKLKSALRTDGDGPRRTAQVVVDAAGNGNGPDDRERDAKAQTGISI